MKVHGDELTANDHLTVIPISLRSISASCSSLFWFADLQRDHNGSVL